MKKDEIYEELAELARVQRIEMADYKSFSAAFDEANEKADSLNKKWDKCKDCEDFVAAELVCSYMSIKYTQPFCSKEDLVQCPLEKKPI